jgi:hypothetical protein
VCGLRRYQAGFQAVSCFDQSEEAIAQMTARAGDCPGMSFLKMDATSGLDFGASYFDVVIDKVR